MGKQMTEMLKGTLEGLVLAILAVRPAYGYEITTRLREQGFSDIVEGTVYSLLVRIEQRGFVDVAKVPSEKGPPRKVYSLSDPRARRTFFSASEARAQVERCRSAGRLLTAAMLTLSTEIATTESVSWSRAPSGALPCGRGRVSRRMGRPAWGGLRRRAGLRTGHGAAQR